MTNSKQTYKNPKAGKSLLSVVTSGCQTPMLEVKFSNLIKPFYYPNSSIPRHSITCVVDPEVDKEFLKSIQAIEKNENVESIIKNETKTEEGEKVNTGKVLIKFQSKDKIPVYLATEPPQLLELEDELAQGERIVVIYDILRYTKKNTMKPQYGISFKPSCIYYYPKE